MGLTVVTNGCFDVLHTGHFELLLFCRQQAGPDGFVIVLVDDDSKIRKDKGHGRPIFNTRERIDAVGSLSIVDQVFQFFSDEDLENRIKNLTPDILVKGADWENKVVVGHKYAKTVMFFPRMPYSSTSIIDRIKKGPEWRTLSR